MNFGLYPMPLFVNPSAPLTTSSSLGLGIDQLTQSEVIFRRSCRQNFSLYGSMKCFAIPVPNVWSVQSWKLPGAAVFVCSVSMNPIRHSFTTSGGNPYVFAWNG